MDLSSAAASRYDCFISFPGSQKLSDLGFTWAGPDCTVRDLAEEVFQRLCVFERNPSVFYDHAKIHGGFPDDLSNAVLQLRGGGIALVLLSREYLRRKYCLAELRAFIELWKLRKVAERESEAVVFRVVCLDADSSSARGALRDPDLHAFVGELDRIQWHPLVHTSTRSLVLKQICDHVTSYWSEKQGLCLGKEMRPCVQYLRTFFVTTLASLIAASFGIRYHEGMSRELIFEEAFLQRRLSAHYLSALLEVTTDLYARDALCAFCWKWISDGWSWSLDSSKNDISLTRCIEKAAEVLSGERARDAKDCGATSSASASAARSPTVDQTTALPNGDVFRPHLPNRQHLSGGLEAVAATSLSRLKTAVRRVRPSDDSTAGSHSSSPASSLPVRDVVLTSIHGVGGVGKTSTCKLLCSDAEVQNDFVDGAILWIDVGQGATEGKVKDEIRRVVSMCGGNQAATKIASSVRVSEAVEIASGFFDGHRILVVLDNVYETPAGFVVHSWAATLAKLATSPGSAVIVTTRFISVSRSPGFDSVDLERYDLTAEGGKGRLAAEHLYDHLLKATLKERSEDVYKTDRQEVLQRSCGLPIVISTFVGLVRIRRTQHGGVGNLLANVRTNVNALVGRSAAAQVKSITCHPGLFAVMEECLLHLDEHAAFDAKVASLHFPEGDDPRSFRAKYCGKSRKQLSSRYAALGVMSKSSTRLSFPVLRHVWHVENAGEIARMFENIGLGRIEEGSNGQDDVFTLHDLQYEYCVSMRAGPPHAAADPNVEIVVSMPGSVSGHALFLSSCEALLLSYLAAGDDVGQGWARFCFAEGRGLSEVPLRRHLTRNLFRHLSGAADEVGVDGVKPTMMSVLSDFGWLRGRVAGDGRSSAVLDCTTALASRSRTIYETRLLTGCAELSIRALQRSLMLVGEDVSGESDGTLAGTLIQLCQSSFGSGDTSLDAVFLKKLACSSESEVRGPLVKPIHGCFRPRDQGVLAQAAVGTRPGGWVWSLAALGDGVHFVSGSEDGAVRVHEIEYLDAVLELEGHTDEVICIGVSKEEGVEGSFLIFSGSDDGAVRSWEVALDPARGVVKKASVVVGDCKSRVWCLSVSCIGDLVAAGTESGTVFVWKRRAGEMLLSFELVSSFGCTVAEKESGCVRGVAVSRSGDLVLAGEQKGGIAFWSGGGTGMEATPDRFCVSDGSDAKLRHVLLSEDESSVSFVFDEPATCEVWDITSRRRSPRVALSDLNVLTCARYTGGEEVFSEGRGACGELVAGGWNQSGSDFIYLLSSSNDFKVLSTYPLASAPRSVCSASFGCGKRILVGSEDGCIRMLDAGVPTASPGAEPHEMRALSLGRDRSEASDASELEEVSTVSVMPAAGHVVAGHADGQFSLWRADNGEFVRSFPGDERGDLVSCVDFSADECLAVFGHENGVALVWNSSAWECRFALEGHSREVICATISADANRIVTVDLDGELRLWNSEVGGAPLWTIETGLEFSEFGSRGAISLDGGLFLWAIRDISGKWRGKVIDIVVGRVSEEARHVDWDALSEEIISSEAFAGKAKVWWRFGAVYCNRIVELVLGIDASQRYAEVWRVSSGNRRCSLLSRIDCALRSANRGAVPAAASLGFDSLVSSIAAGWIPREVDCRRRAVVACRLEGRSYPAILHFIPPST